MKSTTSKVQLFNNSIKCRIPVNSWKLPYDTNDPSKIDQHYMCLNITYWGPHNMPTIPTTTTLWAPDLYNRTTAPSSSVSTNTTEYFLGNRLIAPQWATKATTPHQNTDLQMLVWILKKQGELKAGLASDEEEEEALQRVNKDLKHWKHQLLQG